MMCLAIDSKWKPVKKMNLLKMFSVVNNKLYPSFNIARLTAKDSLSVLLYRKNIKISCLPHGILKEGFFATNDIQLFNSYKLCYDCYTLSPGSHIVLPITLYDVFQSGWIYSGFVSSHRAFVGSSMKIHYSEKNLKIFKDLSFEK